jgi:hypothetical protein
MTDGRTFMTLRWFGLHKDRLRGISATMSGRRLSYCSKTASYLGVAIMVLADNLPILRCPSCGGAMRLIRSVPRPEGLPDLLVVACASCNEVEVKEEKRVA